MAQQSALAETGRAVALGGPSGGFGYAVISAGEIDVQVFADRESMLRALTAKYTRFSRWQFPLSWESVVVFEPDALLPLYMVIEDDESEVEP